MTIDIRSTVFQQLQTHASEHRKQFNSTLLPTIRNETILGVSMPDCRAIAKQMVKQQYDRAFCSLLPHLYLEENIIHMLVLNTYSDMQEWRTAMEAFHPYLDNWMVTDAASPTCKTWNLDTLRTIVAEWIMQPVPYVQRLSIFLLMKLAQRQHFQQADFNMICSLTTEHYYVDMMRAWYFATIFHLQPSLVYDMLTRQVVDTRILRLTVQKILESNKTKESDKAQLRKLRNDLKNAIVEQ